jgi:hypothetical protein
VGSPLLHSIGGLTDQKADMLSVATSWSGNQKATWLGSVPGVGELEIAVTQI